MYDFFSATFPWIVGGIGVAVAMANKDKIDAFIDRTKSDEKDS